MARKADPNTRYKVYLQRDGIYRYASVQEPNPPGAKSKSKYKIKHIGTVDEATMVFTPNPFFRLMDVDERIKYIFPKEWDISKVTAMNDDAYVQKALIAKARLITNDHVDQDKLVSETEYAKLSEEEGTQSLPDLLNMDDSLGQCNEKNKMEGLILPSSNYQDQYNNRLYGSFWLLHQVSIVSGVYNDVLDTFGGNIAKTNEVLSLAFFPYLSERNYNRFVKWQNTHETLLEYPLPAPAITRLTQSITDNDRMNLIQRRVSRLPKGASLDCDSTTRSAWGKCLADIHWGKNKDNEKLRNTLEVVVYSITTHQPIYYRSFAGNTSDMTTVRTVLKDLLSLGLKDVVITADRGYCSDENIAALIAAELPFLLCAKIGSSPIAPLLQTIQYDTDGIPLDMSYDEKLHLYYTQIDVPPYTTNLCDGTPVVVNGLKANLFMNPSARIEEIGAIKRAIDEERTILQEDAEAMVVPSDIKKYNALFCYFKVDYLCNAGDKPIGITFEPLTKKIEKEKSQCGFFGSLMYGQKKTALEALYDYKSRDEHEKNFDQMKNQMKFKVQRNSSQDGKDGRSFILFVGLIVISVLREAWKASNEMQRSYVSTYDMLDEMESIRMSRYADGSSHITTFTSRQVEIAKAAGVNVPLDCMSSTLRKEYETWESMKASRDVHDCRKTAH